MIKAFILDYGCGNIASLKYWFNSESIKSSLISKKEDFKYLTTNAFIVLPGVGHFGRAIKNIDKNGLRKSLLECKGKIPILGICLGSQILLNNSQEDKNSRGLGLVKGETIALPESQSPRTGWYSTKIELEKNSITNRKLNAFNNFFYYNHSYVQIPLKSDNLILLKTDQFCAGFVHKDHIVGLQFHPEKSQLAGKLVLKSVLKFFELL